MNDINWRSLDDQETWDAIVAYPHLQVLVETEVTIRTDRAEYIEDHPVHGPWLSTANEKAKRIAFMG